MKLIYEEARSTAHRKDGESTTAFGKGPVAEIALFEKEAREDWRVPLFLLRLHTGVIPYRDAEEWHAVTISWKTSPVYKKSKAIRWAQRVLDRVDIPDCYEDNEGYE